MDFWRVLENRYSVRNFDPDVDVSSEELDRLLAAAMRSPSAGNRQPWHFYVVRDRNARQALSAAAYGQAFVYQAPVAIVVCADAGESATRYGQRGRTLYCLQDTAAATVHIMLAAVAIGLGSCWVGAFDERMVSASLGLLPQHRPVVILPVGKPLERPAMRTTRKPIGSVASYIG
jgi:nitroreductase